MSLCLLLGILSLKFQNSVLDDDLYLYESTIITHSIKKLEWFGHYGVGIHGFLFKIPVALIFLLTGPSLTIATIYNIILACITLYIFYLILKKIFLNTVYPLLGSLLFFCSFQFILNYPTYMREIPVVLSLLLFIYAILQKKSYWILGLLLLLIMDAKELVFFMVTPGIIVAILINEWKGLNIRGILRQISIYFKLFLPTLTYLLLMLFTSIIPLNTVIFTVIPGITEGGVEYQLKHFEEKAATQSIVKLQNPEAAVIQDFVKTEPSKEIDVKKFSISEKISKIRQKLVGYFGKLLYPRTFSFLSIPKIIFFPAIFTSFILFRKFCKKKSNIGVILSLTLWSFTLVYILRQSFDRYLFPITPVLLIFFLMYLKEVVKSRKIYISIFILSYSLSLAGILFEAEYIYVKLALNTVITLILAIYLYIPDKGKFNLLRFLLISIIAGITFLVSIFYYYASGQFHRYKIFGNDYEIKKVVSNFDRTDRILINDPGWDLLIGAYRGNRAYSAEWKWVLKDWVPRKKHLRIFEDIDTFTISGDIESNFRTVQKNNINKVAIISSNVPHTYFPYQDRVKDYMECKWLKFDRKVDLKNMTLYIFDVVMSN